MPKRNALTEEQIERRRSIDRAAQRNARAKTKARIKELERLVDSLQTSQGDERLQNVMMMLEQQQEETRKLKSTLEAVRKLVGENLSLSPGPQPDAGSENDDGKVFPQPRSVTSGDTLHDPTSHPAAPSSQRSFGSTSPQRFDFPEHLRPAQGFPVKLPTWKSVNNALEKAVEALRQETQISLPADIDIAIRAVVDGWTAAKSARSLDLGWIILKQIDQHVFCDTSPATRLAILRAMRLNLLKLVDSRHSETIVPAFYRQRPSQRMIRHPVLVDFFVWPDLRDHILLSPSLYQPDVFASRFSKNVHFLWADNLSNLYTLDHFSGTYSFSQHFDSRFQDINCWTLSSDFFVHYPQLIGVVPIYNAMPPSLVLRIPTSGHGNSTQEVSSDFGDGMDAEGNMSAFHTFGEGTTWAGPNMFGINQ
ncbi:hypothetical protein, variant [Verruconis gallopava]|uniref:BZIP domain-containing protein n=1 Tax=Verruconis gallopava TaxID=253628 RepID=A0A0D2B5N5_9PEZI|nr:uncharacterized protein PV09_02938 [Verruconis gallopava]XP_016216374.1 hypothetical protein, variant [Verruconis gallopava]KIW06504.1 hypothetical protein PV09_02938 [Verruconis gallopava]KIW06505.1 hypothetical protein, variant [Verruconis gallopava]